MLAPTLSSGFRRHAADVPDRPALLLGSRTISYGECDDTARRWAAGLLDVTNGRAARVGVFGQRSITSYVGVLAALDAGAGFVPLNPRLPVERTRSMLTQAGLDALIVDEAAAGQLPELLAGLADPPPVLLPGSARRGPTGTRVLTKADLAKAAPLRSPVESGAADLAYLLFTSGSTGIPKGVPVTHGNVRSFLDYNQGRYGIQPSDRFSQTFDQTFDLSVFDLFMAWEHGAAVCAMTPVELVSPFDYLESNGVTVWFSVPSVAALLRKRAALKPRSMPTLRWSLFCGEALPRETAEAWQSAAPNSIVENLYGPTELTIACSAYRWNPGVSPSSCVHDNVPIGQLYPHLRSVVVDADLSPVAAGADGELCVTGPQTIPGYWRAPELDAARFFEHRGRRYYRTGDQVRLVDGEYVFLGRNDQQVKISGHRVELGEIEAVLRQAGAVEAVCLLLGEENALVAAVSGATRTPSELLAATVEKLPDHMIPQDVYVIGQLPVNISGKVDRTVLRRWLEHESNGRVPAHQGNERAVSVERLIASTFRIPVDQVTDDLEYQEIRQWDSLGHVALMVALERAYGRQIDNRLTVELRSVAAIKAFAGRAPRNASPAPGQSVRRGLDGVAFDRTEITFIDGVAGELEYRGYSIHDLVERTTFEDVAHLLIFGKLPDAAARDAFVKQLAAGRTVPQPVLEILRSLRDAHPMDALLVAVPALQAYGVARISGRDESYDEARSAGIGLIAAIPMLVAAHHAYRSGREFVAPAEHLSQAEAFLTALLGTEPTATAVRFVNNSFVIHADHSSNASTFVARVATGCRAGVNASVTAAIAAFAGSLHGGAAERAVRLVDRVGDPENAQRYVDEARERNEPIMGFGHRVYRTEDPRVRHLRATVLELSRECRDNSGLRILDAVASAMAPYRRHGLAPNVDLYAGLAYRLMGLPDDLAVPIFVTGRTAGWVAQILEQHSNNVLIRPLLDYVGPHGRHVSGGVAG